MPCATGLMTTAARNLGIGTPAARWSRAAIAGALIFTVAGCASVTSDAPPDPGSVARPPNDAARDVPDSRHAGMIQQALKYVGVPYRWGGSTPAGFDCSGFVQYVYTKRGVPLPRSVAAQYRVGASVRRDGLRPGDLVFFDHLRHNGIYIGDGKFIHASSGEGRVSVSRLDGDWFRHRWTGGRRVPAVGSATEGAASQARPALPNAAAPVD
jgi:cell wall-associated NlpC family hydrolase